MAGTANGAGEGRLGARLKRLSTAAKRAAELTSVTAKAMGMKAHCPAPPGCQPEVDEEHSPWRFRHSGNRVRP